MSLGFAGFSFSKPFSMSITAAQQEQLVRLYPGVATEAVLNDPELAKKYYSMCYFAVALNEMAFQMNLEAIMKQVQNEEIAKLVFESKQVESEKEKEKAVGMAIENIQNLQTEELIQLYQMLNRDPALANLLMEIQSLDTMIGRMNNILESRALWKQADSEIRESMMKLKIYQNDPALLEEVLSIMKDSVRKGTNINKALRHVDEGTHGKTGTMFSYSNTGTYQANSVNAMAVREVDEFLKSKNISAKDIAETMNDVPSYVKKYSKVVETEELIRAKIDALEQRNKLADAALERNGIALEPLLEALSMVQKTNVDDSMRSNSYP